MEPRAHVHEHDNEKYLYFQCPGCGMSHNPRVSTITGKPTWIWNGKLDTPTLTPSVLVRWQWGENREQKVCHSFVTDGRIQFLNDCTHALAGQTVDLPDWVSSQYE